MKSGRCARWYATGGASFSLPPFPCPVAARPIPVGQGERPLSQPEHGVPGGDVVVRAHHLGQAQLQMVEVDVGAAAVAGQEDPAGVLWIEPVAAAGSEEHTSE